MERLKISLDKPIYNEMILDIDRDNIIENNGVFEAYFNIPQRISINDTINFKRYVYSEDFNENVLVSVEKKYVSDLIKDDSGKTIGFTFSGVNDPGYFITNVEQSDIDRNYYKITFNKAINVFGQDLVQNSDVSFYYLNDNFETVTVITDLKMSEIVSNRMASSGITNPLDFIFDRELFVDYNCNPGGDTIKTIPQYYYVPNKLEIRTIYGKINNISPQDLINKFVYKNCNDFYYLDNNQIVFWEDQSGATLNGVSRESGFTTINDYNIINIVKETGYWQVQLGVKNTVDYVHLYQEDNINKLFVDDVNNQIIESAPVIDMEKVKYVPYISGETFNPLTSITYNLHFRVRDLEEEGWQFSGVTSAGTDEDIWWNEQGYYEDDELKSEMVEPSNLVDHNQSDMIGFLGFTDNDIQYQKMKVRKSFIRLLFYDSKDPMTQKLLYYSTIFFDTGELFGKYIKAKNELKLMGMPIDNVVFDSSALTENKLDCNFTVSNEYNTKKSSDGFNLYYFPENEQKTIYMKVEFNHAGYGRTIPMMIWPLDEETNEPKEDLSVSDYLNQVYIPIEIGYIEDEKRYYYMFETSDFITLNDNEDVVSINLVEPRLTMIPKDETDGNN